MAKKGIDPKINTTWMVPDTPVWVVVGKEEVETKKVFMRSVIMNLNNDKTKVTLTKKEDPEIIPNEISVDKIFQANCVNEFGYADMVTMDNLNEAEIIFNLEQRYSKDIIYTYIGPTLIVMNPYKYIESAMNDKLLQTYQNELHSKGYINQREIAPHTYAVAGQAFSNLFQNMKNQSIVISGESGAGKTENAKLAMKFLTTMSSNEQRRISISNNDSSIEERILSCNPILEAFGNAKTVRNDNSSRFGKYVRILVDKKSQKITGASITNYLLEKSRVTVQGQGERNYHIFYHILKGCSASERKKLGLVDNKTGQPLEAEEFLYLKDGGCYEVSTVDDVGLYQEVSESFEKMNFNQHERNTIWKILSAVLLMGNIRFDKSTLTDTKPCTIVGIEFLERCAELLNIDQKTLELCFQMKKRKVGNDVTMSPHNESDIYANRDSLARTLYDHLFNWLVKRLNQTILPQTSLNESVNLDTCLSIGLLDIFGFEVFKINSFEQLCINYTNEKLQQLYISYVFKSEEQEFINEGLKDFIGQLSYQDNQEVIDLMDKYPKGIFDLLDESSSLGSSTDQQLFQKICNTHKTCAFFILNKQSSDSFIIKHTAKSVEYCINGFRIKNKAEISQDIQDTVLSSSNDLVGDIFLGLTGSEVLQKQNIINQPKKPSKNDKFLGAKFRFQMKQLMDELMDADCHFIRCIKPNEQKKKDYFLQGYVFIQIRYLGVLEAIYVRKEGFPYRKNFKDFYTQYGDMVKKYRGVSLKKQIDQKSDLKNICQEIACEVLPHVDKGKLLYGKTKIFTKDDIGKELDELLHKWFQRKNEFASIIQHQFRVYLFRKNILINLKKISRKVYCFQKIAATYKMKKLRKKFLKMKKSVQKIRIIKQKSYKKCVFEIWKGMIIEQLRKERKKKSLKLMINLSIFHIKKKFFNICKKTSDEKKMILLQIEHENKQKEKAAQKQKELQKTKEKELLDNKQQKQVNIEEGISSPQYDSVESPQKDMTMNTESSNEYSTEKKSNSESFQFDSSIQSLNQSFIDSTLNHPDKMIQENLQRGTLAHRMTNILNQKKLDLQYMQNSGVYDDSDEKLQSIIDNFLNPDQTPEEQQGEINIDKINLSQDCSFDITKIQESLKERILENDYFEFCKSIYKKRTNWGRTVPFEIQGFYQKEPLKKTLTNISPLLEPIAIKAFTRMLKYSEVLKSKRDSKTQALKIVELCFNQDQQLQDEVFLQIAKQLQCKDLNIKKKYYSLMAIFSSFISTSSRIIYPLLNCFYNFVLTEKDEINKQRCKFIFTRLRKGFQSPRVYLPTKKEIQLIENRKSIMVPIYIYINRCIFISVESYTDIGNAINFILRELEIESNQRNYCLIEQITIENTDQSNHTESEIEENILQEDEKIMDIFSSWEQERELYRKKKQKINFQAKLIFKIRNFFKFNKYDIDSVFMYFAHSCQDFLNGRYILSDNIVIRLALFKLINDYGDNTECLKILKNVSLNINQYIPINERSEFMVKNWQTQMLFMCKKIDSCSSAQARTMFLNTLKKHSFMFMSHQFICHYYMSGGISRTSSSQNSSVEEVIVAIKPFEILILEKQSKDLIDQFRLADILKFGKQSQNRMTIILGDSKTYHFQVKDADSYILIINNYIKMALNPAF